MNEQEKAHVVVYRDMLNTWHGDNPMGAIAGFAPEQEFILRLRTKLEREYYEGREKLRMPKDKDYTEWDRKTMLEASIAALREQYEYVKGLEELVRERVELYKLMMKG